MRKFFVFAVVLVSALLSACSSQRDICAEIKTHSPLIVVMTAFNTETQAVLDNVKFEGVCERDGHELALVQTGSKELVLYQVGVGPVKSSDSTKWLLSNYKVRAIVFSGIAGAVDQSLKTGDTLIPTEWMVLDGASISADGNLLKIAIVEKRVRGVSVDHFLSNIDEVPPKLGVSIVDMESAYVAREAARHQIPFIAVRSVSDMANGEKDPEKYKVAAKASAATALKLIEALETP